MTNKKEISEKKKLNKQLKYYFEYYRARECKNSRNISISGGQREITRFEWKKHITLLNKTWVQPKTIYINFSVLPWQHQQRLEWESQIQRFFSIFLWRIERKNNNQSKINFRMCLNLKTSHFFSLHLSPICNNIKMGFSRALSFIAGPKTQTHVFSYGKKTLSFYSVLDKQKQVVKLTTSRTK